jgi:hypothetical protein
MKIYNHLPLLIDYLKRWEKLPMLEDWGIQNASDFHQELAELNWKVYRAETLLLSPDKEEVRLKKHLQGVDESHGRGAYLDILVSHELTHDEFGENQPVAEHLFSEGFSCVVSELLNQTDEPWHYVYQTKESYQHVMEHSNAWGQMGKDLSKVFVPKNLFSMRSKRTCALQ